MLFFIVRIVSGLCAHSQDLIIKQHTQDHSKRRVFVLFNKQLLKRA